MPTPDVAALASARLRTVKATEPIEVTAHFNPASLQYTVANTLKEEGRGAKKKQYVSQTTAKLAMELVFDTTTTGEDVRETTDRMARLLKPHGPSGKQVPPLVEFGWGVYRFTGMVEQYQETLDFFAAGGVPLRASVNLTLASQDVVFESNRNPSASVDADLAAEPVTMPAASGPAGGPAGLANALGDPRAARAIAAANGAASLRFSAGAELAIGAGAGVSLAGAAAFSAGVGASAGIGVGVNAGTGLAITGAAGVGASVGGVTDFSGLRAAAQAGMTVPDPGAALALSAGTGAAGGVEFALGGRAQVRGSASLSADVGANAELTTRLRFGG